VFEHLHVYNRRERLIVGTADLLLTPIAPVAQLLTHRAPDGPPRRILLLRLERIGDLLMALRAIDRLRRRAPQAHIHLVVGSWNEPLAALMKSVDSVETLDVPWLARHAAGSTTGALIGRALEWRRQAFDLAVNFEPDIRSNALLALSAAPRRFGFRSAGGGGLLTTALDYDRGAHTSDNLLRLVDAAVPHEGNQIEATEARLLEVPVASREEAGRLLGVDDPSGALVGIHVSGGRPVKQWHPERFAAVGAHLARTLPATLVLTGTTEDRPLVAQLIAALPPEVRRIDLAGNVSLPVMAAILERLHLFMTGDTGPMHLAAAVGTPTVAIFGPSDPRRYGPLTERARVVTADLWCRPCSRVRRPPARCSRGVPDCLNGVTVEMVTRAAEDLLRSDRRS
jgi:lipopolysaccharide heptosyltransferase II